MTKKVFYGYGGNEPMTEEELTDEYRRLGITPKADSSVPEAAGSASVTEEKVTHHDGNANFH